MDYIDIDDIDADLDDNDELDLASVESAGL